MTEDNKDRSQSEGQEGIDRETERRNRENETGQQGKQPETSETGQPPSSQDRPSSAFGQQGQSAGGDTTLSQRTGQTGGQSATGEATGTATFGQQGGQGGSSFVGSSSDQSSDYLTKGEQNQDFAAEGQGAQDNNAGNADIETGQPQDDSDDSTPTGK
jgi:hypothetical protein